MIRPMAHLPNATTALGIEVWVQHLIHRYKLQNRRYPTASIGVQLHYDNRPKQGDLRGCTTPALKSGTFLAPRYRNTALDNTGTLRSR